MIQDRKAFMIKTLQHLAAVLFFLLATVIYFSPEFFDGKSLPQHDVTQFKGSSEDLRSYYDNEGESSAWTGGMFSGMPAYQIGVWGGSPNMLDYVEAPLKALGKTTAGTVFTGMLMAYILFLILGFRIPMAMFGAVAYSLSSYNIIILDAGHVTKAWALAYMPIVVAGILAMYKNKYIVGGLCMALGLALQIKNNHLQMTYYTAILCLILYIGLVIKNIKGKTYFSLIKSSGILALAVAIALITNAAAIYSNFEMSQTSTRGKSELTAQAGENQKTDGLDKDYVFGWSYGKAETFSLLVPNIHGGGSVTWLDSSSNLHNEMVKQGYGSQIDAKGVQAYTYWGDQPGTSGPVYFGALVCFLFLLGMLIIRNPMKWVLLGATVFFIFLAWGKNFEAFNDIFYNYFPLYSKFRAVSQALVIPALLMVIVAVWAIREFVEGKIEKKELNKALYIAGGITGGLCLILWIMPNAFFNFVSPNDAAWRAQMPEWFYPATLADRQSMLSTDALRSLIFIVLGAASMWYVTNMSKLKNGTTVVVFILMTLILVDLWTVDKRFLNDSKFVKERMQVSFKKSPVDEAIHQDKDLSYRVLNLNNPFNETTTSYYHKSIGGYHAAKLQRYQQLIEHRLQGELGNIYQSFKTQDADSIQSRLVDNTALNMLNTRYLIFDPSQPPLTNPYAMGNAWFVNKYSLVENADAEIAALNTINPREEAVIDKRYQAELNNFTPSPDSTATIQLVAYKPNVLTYKTKTNSDQLAIFSEIYYANGWKAYVDGKLTPHFCADWTLRAMIVPKGEHEIVFKFEPTAYNTARTVTTVSSGILILLLLGTIVWYVLRVGKREEEVK